MIKIDFFTEKKPTKKHTIPNAILSLVLYFLVMVFGATFIYLALTDNEGFMQTYGETDSLIQTLGTKNGIGLVTKDEFNSSFYHDADLDIYSFITAEEPDSNDSDGVLILLNTTEESLDFLNDYLLIASKGAFTKAQTKDINEKFIKLVFTEETFYNNAYRVYRIIPQSLYDNEEKMNELFTYFDIDDPVFDYKSKEFTDLNSYGSALVNFILYVVLIVGLVLLLFNAIKADVLRLNSFKDAIIPALFGVLIVYLGNIAGNMLTIIVSSLFKERVVESVNQASIVDILSTNYAPLMIIAVVLLGPIVEELVFRKSMFSLFKNKIAALIISSLAFGLIHVLGESSIQTMIIAIIPYLVPGLALGYIYLKNDENIIIPIITHVLLNTISVILIFLI